MGRTSKGGESVTVCLGIDSHGWGMVFEEMESQVRMVCDQDLGMPERQGVGLGRLFDVCNDGA